MGNFVRTRTHTRETRTRSHGYGLGTGFFTGFLWVFFFAGSRVPRVLQPYFLFHCYFYLLLLCMSKWVLLSTCAHVHAGARMGGRVGRWA
jgi:hypothetical protein